MVRNKNYSQKGLTIAALIGTLGIAAWMLKPERQGMLPLRPYNERGGVSTNPTKNPENPSNPIIKPTTRPNLPENPQNHNIPEGGNDEPPRESGQNRLVSGMLEDIIRTDWDQPDSLKLFKDVLYWAETNVHQIRREAYGNARMSAESNVPEMGNDGRLKAGNYKILSVLEKKDETVRMTESLTRKIRQTSEFEKYGLQIRWDYGGKPKSAHLSLETMPDGTIGIEYRSPEGGARLNTNNLRSGPVLTSTRWNTTGGKKEFSERATTYELGTISLAGAQTLKGGLEDYLVRRVSEGKE